MTFFKKFDEKQAVQAVKSFFKEDSSGPYYTYEELKRFSGSWGELKSPKMDVTGISGSGGGNSTEHRFVKHVECQRAVQAVDYAIKGCDSLSQLILERRYLNGETISSICDSLRLSGHATWDKLDKRACFQFLQCFDYAVDVFGVDKKLVSQLLVYR